MPTRRTFLIATTVGLGALASHGHAQTSKRPKRVGFVALNPSSAVEAHGWNELVDELRERGWVEGQNFVFEFRYFFGDRTRLPGLMAELIALDVDVIFVQGSYAALAAKEATQRIPIVFFVGDAVGRGVVTNLARPEGNATGVSSMFVEHMAKLVELLKQVAPAVSRVAALMNTDVGYPPALFKEPKPRGVEVFIVPLRRPDELAAAMTTVARQRADAVAVGQFWLDQPQFRNEIVESVTRARLPAAFPSRAFVEMGGLLSYAIPESGAWRHVAVYIDRILRGARPADLPVEQPTTYELAVNLRTAKALGITIPPEILVRADLVVE